MLPIGLLSVNKKVTQLTWNNGSKRIFNSWKTTENFILLFKEKK